MHILEFSARLGIIRGWPGDLLVEVAEGGNYEVAQRLLFEGIIQPPPESVTLTDTLIITVISRRVGDHLDHTKTVEVLLNIEAEVNSLFWCILGFE